MTRVSGFFTTHQHNQAIQCHSHWMIWEIQENNRQIKYTENTETKYNIKNKQRKIE